MTWQRAAAGIVMLVEPLVGNTKAYALQCRRRNLLRLAAG